jgi:hypothetical protein
MPAALACGYSQAQLDSLAQWQDSTVFNERERALLAYLDQAIRSKAEVDDKIFEDALVSFLKRPPRYRSPAARRGDRNEFDLGASNDPNTDIDHWFTNGRTSSYLHDKHLDARPSCATTRATVKT